MEPVIDPWAAYLTLALYAGLMIGVVHLFASHIGRESKDHFLVADRKAFGFSGGRLGRRVMDLGAGHFLLFTQGLHTRYRWSVLVHGSKRRLLSHIRPGCSRDATAESIGV
jgi:hypothetical protein